MKKFFSILFLGMVPIVLSAQEADPLLLDVCVGSMEDTLCTHQYVFEFDSDSSGMYYNELIIYARVRMLDTTSAIYQPYGWVRNFSVLVTDKDGNIGDGGPFSFASIGTEYHLQRSMSITSGCFGDILTADTFCVTLHVTFDDFESPGFMITDPQVYKIPNTLVVTGIKEETDILGVFPNPITNGFVTISASRSVDVVTIHDMTGKVVKELAPNTRSFVGDLPAGVYVARSEAIRPRRIVIH